MAKGLTERKRKKTFEMLNTCFDYDAIAGKLQTLPAWEIIHAKGFRRTASGFSGIPTEEEERIEFLNAALSAHDRTEPSYSALCANMCWTIWLCGKNRSSELERDCTAHVIDAFRAGAIKADEIPMDSIGNILTSHINFHIEFPDKSDAEIEDLFSWCERLIDDGLFDRREWYELRAVHAVSKGSFDEAKQYMRRFLKMPRSEASDCEGCEFDRLIKGYMKMNLLARAAHYVAVILDMSLKCESDIPEKTRIQYALTSQFVGPDKASPQKLAKLLDEASKDLYANKYLIFEAAVYICAARNLDAFDEANDAIEMFRPIVAEYPYEVGNFQFYLAAYFLKSQAGEETDAQAWLEKARAYAEAFDKRNGNEHYIRTIEDTIRSGGLWRN